MAPAPSGSLNGSLIGAPNGKAGGAANGAANGKANGKAGGQPSGCGPAFGERIVLRDDASFEELDNLLGISAVSAGIRHRVSAFSLERIDARRTYQVLGYRTATEYAAHRFGFSRREARELLRVGKAMRELRAIDHAFGERVLSWTKVRLLVRVATPATEDRWLEVATELTADNLALEIKLARPGDAPRCRDQRKGLSEVRLRLEADLPPDVYAMWEQVARHVRSSTKRPVKDWECIEAMCEGYLARERSENPTRGVVNSNFTVVINRCVSGGDDVDVAVVDTEDGPVPIATETADCIECDCGSVDVGRPNGKKKKKIPNAMRLRVLARDGFRCRRCRMRDTIQAHHVVAESEGGPTDEKNLVAQCRWCHTLIHAGLITIDGTDANNEDLGYLDRDGNRIGAAWMPSAEQCMEIPALIFECTASVVDAGGLVGGVLGGVLGGAARGAAPRVREAPVDRLDDLFGQRRVVNSLHTMISVANLLDEPLGHTLFTGPAGCGKTALARAIAGELGVGLVSVNGPDLRTPAQVRGILAGLKPRDVLFIDEIHSIPGHVAESLYPAMDAARHGVPFTLVGASTRHGSLPDPFRSRFENAELVTLYELDELVRIIEREIDTIRPDDLTIDPLAAGRLARVARGRPRRALGLARRARNHAVVGGRHRIDMAIVKQTLDSLGIDERGLDPVEQAYLRELRSRSRPIALERLARLIGVDPVVLRDEHEPWLLKLGLIEVTPFGRRCA